MKISKREEWTRLKKKEERYLKRKERKKEPILNRKLSEKVPEKLQNTLDTAFEKAFSLVFRKGTAVVEKTMNKKGVKQNKRNLLLSGITGAGLGILGIGIPDIPVFTGMIFKAVYEIAKSYGFSYDSEGERYYILLLIRTAVSHGPQVREMNEKVNDYIKSDWLPLDYIREEEIEKTAKALSEELLYMKFIQGIPIVGVTGGIYDAVYMREIIKYADLKYRQRKALSEHKKPTAGN